MTESISNAKAPREGSAASPVTYWRVEGSLLELGAMRAVGFFTWNSQSFSERWARRLGMTGMALTRPFAYAASRTFATRLLHTLLRGVSQDRLDLLGEEYFHYVLKPQLRRESVEKLLDVLRSGEQIVLVSQLLDHVLRPLANHFGISPFVSNRLEFREGHATGRLLAPIVRPRGPLAWIASGSTDGRMAREKLLAQLGWMKQPGRLESALQTATRPVVPIRRAVSVFGDVPRLDRLAVCDTLSKRHILLVGVTGFIGKVWLVDLLENVSTIGKITLLIRRNRRFAAIATLRPSVASRKSSRNHRPLTLSRSGTAANSALS